MMNPNPPNNEGWRKDNQAPSLQEVHRTIPVPKSFGFWRKLLAFSGPGYLVAVGYMDPGNWATDLAGGSAFATPCSPSFCFRISWRFCFNRFARGSASPRDATLRKRAAIIIPSPSPSFSGALRNRHLRVRSGGSRRLGHRAQFAFSHPARHRRLPHRARRAGHSVSSKQRFPLHRGACHFAYAAHRRCFLLEIIFSRPDFREVLGGFIPRLEIIKNPEMLLIAIGILGATVMPHNLYLHSSIVQTRKYEQTPDGKREAIKFATIDSTMALMFALFINAAILIVSAATFHTRGQNDVAEIQDAYQLLSPTSA
ncbi:MAG: divalent metal cation transporter [Limisphaerales bacterium]